MIRTTSYNAETYYNLVDTFKVAKHRYKGTATLNKLQLAIIKEFLLFKNGTANNYFLATDFDGLCAIAEKLEHVGLQAYVNKLAEPQAEAEARVVKFKTTISHLRARIDKKCGEYCEALKIKDEQIKRLTKTGHGRIYAAHLVTNKIQRAYHAVVGKTIDIDHASENELKALDLVLDTLQAK